MILVRYPDYAYLAMHVPIEFLLVQILIVPAYSYLKVYIIGAK
jgi:hypothetical protein